MGSTIEHIAPWVCAWIARTLQIDVAAIDPRQRLFDLGLGSLHGIKLAADLAALLARPVSPTVLWEHPTISELAAHLAGEPGDRPPNSAHSQEQISGPGPIAIVGMACRFPRAPDLDAFWALLAAGVDATGPAPADRWELTRWVDPDPSTPGKSVTGRGAFLDDVRGFEPLFFGISPREADELDPQQRLALELAWEALEDAGVPPRGLAGSRTGVYLGSMWHDWADLTHAHVEGMSSHRATGTANNLIANRVSYVLGLRGPSLVVDTACSTALVAIHLGCQALALGDAELVLAGAVNLMLAPESMVFCSKFGGLAPDGRCKTFDASADGFARGEGGGVVVLKPLRRALADGDRIHAVLRGSAVNNDGASQGLTAPNPRAQEEVLQAALARAGLAGEAVHYVEAHGTGTLLGDPIEAAALGAVLGAGRPPGRPLYVGSVKTNIGHTEGAAGIAGVLKSALAMRHRALPPSLHLHTPNPHIPFAALRLRVPTERQPWPAPLDAPALAGVSAFGWGGTNAHVLLESPPPEPRSLCLAAADEPALTDRLRTLLAACEHSELESLVVDAGEGPARLAVLTRSTDELRAQLAAALANHAHDGLLRGTAGIPRVAFICSPLGSQWPGMARQLLRSEPAFRAEIGRCDRAFAPLLGRSLRDDLAGAWTDIDDVVRVQPLLFAVQAGLAALWRAWGVVPDAVLGHSAGEVAAAYIAGALDLDQAALVVHHYARVQLPGAGLGAMAVVALGREAIAPWLAAHAGVVVVAAHNSASSTVISGATAAVREILGALQLAGVACSPIRTDVAGHSPLVAPGLPDLAAALASLRPAAPRIPLYSSVTGDLSTTPVDGAYWAQNLGQPVRFHEALLKILADGHDTLVELGPHPVVSHAIHEVAAERAIEIHAHATLRRAADERLSLLATRGALFVAGATRSPPPAPAQLLVLSARTAPALEQARHAHLKILESRPHDPADLCFTAATRRSHLEHRLAVVADSRAGLAAALRRGGVRGQALTRPRIVFVFPGQGSQWLGMGRSLLADQPVFRAAFTACADALAPHLDRPLLTELLADDARLHRSDVVQPLLWAFGVALAALWRELGVHPDAVIGHSMGEVAAACVAGALSLADGARIIALRSRLARAHVGERGAMAVVELSLADAERAVSEVTPRVVVGVHNGPRECVLSGEPAALDEVLAALEARGVFCRRVRVDYASHSPQMHALAAPLLAALADLTPRAGTIPMLSTLTGEWLSGAHLNADYWAANIRERVRFADAVARLQRSEPGEPTSTWADRPRLLLEVSPHPVLTAAMRDGLAGTPHLALGTLRRDEDERTCLLEALGTLHVHGGDPSLTRLFPDGGRTVTLPAVPWQRTPHWFAASPAPRPTAGHPRLGLAFTTPAQPGAHFFTTTLAPTDLPYLADHRVGDAAIVPGATWLDLVLTAALTTNHPQHALLDVAFHAALVLPESGAADVQVVLTPTAADELRFECFARVAESWTRHASGLLRPAADLLRPDLAPLTLPREPGRPGDEFYADLSAIGLAYGPRCRGVTELWRTQDRVLARLTAPADSDSPGSRINPPLLDAAMHSLVALVPDRDDPRPLVPAALARLQLHRSPGPPAWVSATLTARTRDRHECALTVYDPAGAPLLTIDGLVLQRLAGARVRHDDLLTLAWRELDLPARVPRPRRWLLVPDRDDLAPRLRALLLAEGDHVDLLTPGAAPPGPHDGVLHLAALDATLPADATGSDAMHAAIAVVDPALQLTQTLLRGDPRDLPRLYFLTRGAQHPATAPVQAPLWGLGLTLAYEHPELRCTRIDLADLSDATLATLVTELHADAPEDQLVLDGPRRLGARLVPGTVAAHDPDLLRDEPQPIVITGGLGGLGLALATWLLDRGAQHLILLARAPTDPPPELTRLRSRGARIDVHAVDVADLPALTAVFTALPSPPAAIFHAAGVLDDALIANQDRRSLERVMASKIAGAWNLHRLTRDLPLRCFVLYSSVAALIGSPGQSNYAAANAFLDALAAHRHALGLPALAIDWGSIADVGLAARDPQRGARLASRGMPALALADAHARLARLLADPTLARIAVVRLDPRQWLESYPGAAASPLFHELRAPAPAAATHELRTTLISADSGERARLVEQLLRAQVLRVLRVDESRVHHRVNLLELGLDSLTGLELRNRLESGLGLQLRSTLVWTYPRLDELAAHLTGLVAAAHAPIPAPEPPPPPPEDTLAQLSDDELLRALAAELEAAP